MNESIDAFLIEAATIRLNNSHIILVCASFSHRIVCGAREWAEIEIDLRESFVPMVYFSGGLKKRRIWWTRIEEMISDVSGAGATQNDQPYQYANELYMHRPRVTNNKQIRFGCRALINSSAHLRTLHCIPANLLMFSLTRQPSLSFSLYHFLIVQLRCTVES